MKKLLFVMLAATLGFLSVQAQEKESLVIPAGHAKELVLGAGMNVVLVPVTGEEDLGFGRNILGKLKISLSGTTMQVMPDDAFIQDTKVFVLVNDLSSLTIGEGTSVVNQGFIRSKLLKVYLNEHSNARLVTNAKVKAYSLGDFDINLTYTPIRNSVASVR